MGRVDLLLIHSPRAWRGGTGRCSVAETWAALEEAHAAGQARSIGVSNFRVADLERLAATAKVRPALNQCSHSVSYHDDATAAYCEQRGIVYEAYSPLCGGANGSSCEHGSVLSIPLVQEIAISHDHSTPISPIYLPISPYISTISPYISLISPYISPVSRAGDRDLARRLRRAGRTARLDRPV